MLSKEENMKNEFLTGKSLHLQFVCCFNYLCEQTNIERYVNNLKLVSDLFYKQQN